MATTFVDVLLQVRDELGADALAGGFVYTYAAGTSTPLVTYQELNGTANTNPVELDDAGMAVIRQTDGVAYKWEITDADNNLLWTRDNITVGVAADGAGSDYLVLVNFLGQPGAQSWLGGDIAEDSVLLPIDFEGALGSVQTNPGSDYAVSIRKNAVEVGTATFDSSGNVTFATTGGTTVTLSAGDELDFYAPDSGTAAGIKIKLVGSLT